MYERGREQLLLLLLIVGVLALLALVFAVRLAPVFHAVSRGFGG